MRKHTGQLGLLSVTAMLCANIAAADSADLRPKFAKGRITYYRQTTHVTQNMKTDDQPQRTNVVQETGIRLKVMDVHDDGSVDLEYTIMYVRFSGRSPQMPMRFDSRKPRARGTVPLLATVGAMVDKPMMLHITPDGMVKEIDGVDEIKSAISMMMKEVLTEDMLRQEHGLRTPGRKATHPTKMGSKWNDQVAGTVPGGTLTSSITYTLEHVDSEKHTAEITAGFELQLKPSPRAGAMFNLEDGRGSARLTWDMDKGELVSLVGVQEMVLKQRVPEDVSVEVPDVTQKINIKAERIALADMNLPEPAPAGDDERDPQGDKKVEDKSQDDKAEDKPKDE